MTRENKNIGLLGLSSYANGHKTSGLISKLKNLQDQILLPMRLPKVLYKTCNSTHYLPLAPSTQHKFPTTTKQKTHRRDNFITTSCVGRGLYLQEQRKHKLQETASLRPAIPLLDQQSSANMNSPVSP